MKRFWGILFTLVVVFSLVAIGLPSPVFAQGSSSEVVYVDIDNVAGPWDGTSWATAYQTIQEGLDDAYLAGKEVWVAAGTHKPTSTIDRTLSFQLKSGVALYGGFDGTQTVLEQRDWVTNVTILSGDIGILGDNSDNSYHVVVGADSATLDGFIVTGGNANLRTAGYDQGGGMYNVYSSPTVTNCIFSNNSAVWGGGGMCNRYSSPTVSNCTFANNSGGSYGGGMRNASSSPAVSRCTFRDNSASIGGGMYNYDRSSPTIINCIFYNNSAMGVDYGGGAMCNYSRSSPTVTNCTFFNNSANAHGDGIFNAASSSATVTNCILWDNGEEIYPESSTRVSYSDIQAGYPGEGNISADPLFVDPIAGDYRLQAGSPCIDAGTNEGAPNEDIEGNPRPIDGDGDTVAVTDMGAYEYIPTNGGGNGGNGGDNGDDGITVGGSVAQVDKFDLMMPWIIATALVLLAITSLALWMKKNKT